MTSKFRVCEEVAEEEEEESLFFLTLLVLAFPRGANNTCLNKHSVRAIFKGWNSQGHTTRLLNGTLPVFTTIMLVKHYSLVSLPIPRPGLCSGEFI